MGTVEALPNQIDQWHGALHVMVLYDASNVHALGKRIYECIWARLPAGAGIRLSLWQFESLTDPNTEQLAFHDLIDAHVLTVVSEASRMLPVHVRKGLNKWLLPKWGVRVGLLAILTGVEEQDKELSPVHSFLQLAATKAGIDFFAQGIPGTGVDGASGLINPTPPITLDFVWDEDAFAPVARIAG